MTADQRTTCRLTGLAAAPARLSRESLSDVVPPKVVVVSGHMVDEVDRPSPRFPPTEVPRVTREVAEVFDGWAVGPGTTVVTSGARGADIIAAELGLARGASVTLCLALPPDEFERRSVTLPESGWVARFRQLLAAAEVRVLDERTTVDSSDIFAKANAWLLDVARMFGGPQPHALLVWNGEKGDGPGGTRDFVRQLGVLGPDPQRVRVIDPTPRRYEARQTASGPKKLLALDGGGIRGALSLELLFRMESQLRLHADDPSLVLGDYFDYVAGANTGAIIAAGLACGYPVAELAAKYASLGRDIFHHQKLLLRLWSLYSHKPLSRELTAMFGNQLTLGDPHLRSLLLVVLHNTGTDSPWPLSNCTRATYNRADRFLVEPSDRNLDLPLVQLLRGSTAAPMFFQPQAIEIGPSRFVFQDGGITPFNNPAFLLFLMATLPEYELGWKLGEDELLLVSVGTGSAAAVHPGLLARQVHMFFNARNLPGVFMNGASVGQDLMCRAIGRCRYGDPLDSEVGDLVGRGALIGAPAFAYVRYNADLSDTALSSLKLSRKVRRRARRLDAVECLDVLRHIGQRAATGIDVTNHFGGFL